MLRVQVVPGASGTRVVGIHGDSLRVRVTAPPEKGRANRAVEALLGDFFGTTVTVLTGGTGRRKHVEISGLAAAEVAERIRSGLG